MPEAAAVGDALSIDLVRGSGDFADFIGREEAPNDRIAIAPIVREMLLSGCRCDRSAAAASNP